MTAADLHDWQVHMGLTYQGAADALGVSRSTFAAWRAGARVIPGCVGLACAALAAGLVEWRATASNIQ